MEELGIQPQEVAPSDFAAPEPGSLLRLDRRVRFECGDPAAQVDDAHGREQWPCLCRVLLKGMAARPVLRELGRWQ